MVIKMEKKRNVLILEKENGILKKVLIVPKDIPLDRIRNKKQIISITS